MIYSNKIAVVLKADLQDWQKLNVVSFLASSVAIQFPETHGKSFVSASGTSYLPFIKHPVILYAAQHEADLKRAFSRAQERGLAIGIYTESLFGTKCEEENLIEIAKYKDDEQTIVGFIVYGENKKVNKALDKLKLHS